MNNGRNGQYRNNRYSNGNRSPYPDDSYRRSGYSQSRNSRSRGIDSADRYSYGNYSRSSYSSSGSQRTGNRDYVNDSTSEYDSYDYYNSVDYSMDDYTPSDYRDNGSSMYSARRSTNYNGNRSSGYSGGGSSGYSGGRSSGYSGGRSSGYSGGGNRNKSRKSSYSKDRDNDEKLPVSVFLGIGVTVIAVITLFVSISVNSSKSKNRNHAYTDNSSSQSESGEPMIVDVNDDDENEEDGNTDSSQLSVESFVGTWYKTDVTESKKATFTVTMQYIDSFEFRLEIWNGSESAVINGTAFYSDETHAEYSPKKKIKINFERGSDYVSITHTGSNSSFGIGAGFTIDGKFTELEPSYAVESVTSSEPVATVTYDYYIYKSDAVVKALKNTLNSDDYALYKDLMEKGLKSPIDYERTKDKNGLLVNVDAELNAVKYYAHLSSNGYDMIFICSDNADIYVLFYNSEEIVYYTNDRNYSSNMPASFQAVAKAKDIKPTFR